MSQARALDYDALVIEQIVPEMREQCVDPELLLVARGSAWGRELLLGLGDVVARTRSARDALLELIRVAVLGAGTGQRQILRLPQGCLAIPILRAVVVDPTPAA